MHPISTVCLRTKSGRHTLLCIFIIRRCHELHFFASRICYLFIRRRRHGAQTKDYYDFSVPLRSKLQHPPH
jgi:hypothetical protein